MDDRASSESFSAPLAVRGLTPGRPLSGEALDLNVRATGMQARPARNAALVTVASELRPAVLADILGLHHETATRWANLAGRDWQAYLATRSTNTAAPE